MKKIISILMIAALAGFMAIGCSTPEAEGTKPGDASTTPTGNGAKDDGKGTAEAPGLKADEAPKTDAPKTDAPKTEGH